ncbi:aromatic ring-hydroxylating dioxygenase subunit alpha [Novosphingobium sp. SL115]|uniref:aromatic ring-hydroxylating oxygenase subunit alpha n=1 Tax=Novosphingobium sp. SL115 TaxID=2995150 RepID=UPI00227340DF|nr:aromatic ring-hydroxylating dioxygenase subunit alpha [Novosphingobium sp. SL115]MCY1669505.1 aromatic ring-hydroxylating dioxygenase subunit alpha [Novosphingobium sp. SL115]
MQWPTFDDFANLWVCVCSAKALTANSLMSVDVAGERIALFRDGSGNAVAMVDRCPHRGVALSLGTLEYGTVSCPFHGWRFDGNGRCLHVPWNPEAKLDRLSARTVPVREAGNLIWLYTGFAPSSEPFIPPTLLRSDVRLTAQSFVWNVHWTRVMENMLDTPHLPFVHARTIGKRFRSKTAAAMQMRWEPTEYGGEVITCRSGERPMTNLRYYYPNAMELTIDPAGRVLRMLAVCTPNKDGRTKLSLYTLRNFAKARALDWVFARTNARIAAEDKAIVESSIPAHVPTAGEEVSVATDAPTLAFRKIWFTRIRGSIAAAP